MLFGPTTKDRRAPLLPGLQMKGDAIAGRYRVEKLLGAGSSGFVVEARHIFLRRRVTLKILTSVTNAQQRAQRQCLARAHVAASLRSRHVARIVDTGFTEEGMPFIATERLQGRTLADELLQVGRIPHEIAVQWTLHVCEALAEAHALGLVHGDLKPQNLFVVTTDEPRSEPEEWGEAARSIKVLDFGMSSPLGGAAESDADAELTAASTWFSSPAYLSPEQLRAPHEVDHRVDIWALGVILHRMISGSLPFQGSSVSATLVAVAHDEPPMLTGPDVPFELARRIHTCLSKDPAARPQDVVTLARDLAPLGGVLGAELSARVEAAASAHVPARPSASTIELLEGERPSTSGRSEASGAGLISREASPCRQHDRAPRSISRLRLGRVAATLAAAGALSGLVGLRVAQAPISVDPRDTSDGAEPPSVPREQAPPLPFIPHSFGFADRSEAASPRRTSTAPPRSPARESRSIDSVSMPAARALARDVPPTRPRPPLAVRESRAGFTHPTRLPDSR